MARENGIRCGEFARDDLILLPPSTGEGRDRGAEKITPSFVLPRGRLCQSVILRRSRRICFFISRWKSRCFAFAQHDIQVICGIATQSLDRGGRNRNSLPAANYVEHGHRWFIASSLIGIFLLAAVATLGAQDKKLDSFTISYASVSGTRGPLWIAKDLGLFEKYGLDGNLVYIASGVTSVNALLGGSVDIIAASGSSAVGAAARGAPIVIIASLGHIAYKLIAHPSITTVQGLKGKIIGSSRIGAGTDFALQRLLPKLGLIPGKDVTLLATGVSESDRRLLMLMQGKIDATLGTEDNLLQLAAKGMKFSVLADVYEAGIYTTGSDIATSRQLLKQKPRQLKAFIMALTEGTYIGRTQKEQALRVFRKYLKIEDPKMLDSMHKNNMIASIPARPFTKE